MNNWLRAEAAELMDLAAAQEASSLNHLIPLLYTELRRIAKRQLCSEDARATLVPLHSDSARNGQKNKLGNAAVGHLWDDDEFPEFEASGDDILAE